MFCFRKFILCSRELEQTPIIRIRASVKLKNKLRTTFCRAELSPAGKGKEKSVAVQKLYGSQEDLRKTATFIILSGLIL